VLEAVVYLPLAHTLHIVAPAAELNFPGRHAMQLDELAAATVPEAYFPVSQAVQTEVPLIEAYFPVTHAIHDVFRVNTDMSEYFPTVHETQLVAPLIEACFPVAHAIHDVFRANPDMLEYFPTVHETQLVAPVAVTYFPASHGVQAGALDILENHPTEQLKQPS
jgi:hypothetical protein